MPLVCVTAFVFAVDIVGNMYQPYVQRLIVGIFTHDMYDMIQTNLDVFHLRLCCTSQTLIYLDPDGSKCVARPVYSQFARHRGCCTCLRAVDMLSRVESQ